jgi:hypothetical protein
VESSTKNKRGEQHETNRAKHHGKQPQSIARKQPLKTARKTTAENSLQDAASLHLLCGFFVPIKAVCLLKICGWDVPCGIIFIWSPKKKTRV